jgi:hypothetical protein
MTNTKPAVVTPEIIRAMLVPGDSSPSDLAAYRLSIELHCKVRSLVLHNQDATLTLIVQTRGRLATKEEREKVLEHFRQAGWYHPILTITPSHHPREEDEINLVVQSFPLQRHHPE